MTVRRARTRSRRRAGFVAVAALLWLCAVFAFDVDLYSRTPGFAAALPVEPLCAAALFALLALIPAPRARAAAIAGFTLVALLALLDTLAPALFGRRLDLVWDSRNIPNVVDVLFTSLAPWHAVALGVAALAALALVIWPTVWALRRVADAVARRPGPALALALPTLAVLAGLAVAGVAPPGLTAARGFVAAGLHAAESWRWLTARESTLAAFAAERDGLIGADTRLRGLAGRSVYLLFVESYGASLFAHDRSAAVARPLLRDAEARLAAAGFAAASARLVSPTYGGRSWLAHATLTGGVRIADNFQYRMFLRSGLDSLVHVLRRDGRRAVLFMPGIRRDWPEGRLLGFDRVYQAPDLDYRGPAFGWFEIPDQVTLQRAAVREIAPAAGPLFVMAALITSHVPFHPLPPLLADWAAVDDPAAWDAAVIAADSFAGPDWADVHGLYAAGAAYSLSAVFEFVARHAGPDALVLVAGDHQPPGYVSWGAGGDDVPLHVLSRDPALVAPFLARGYAPGLTLPDAAAARPMEGVLGTLLDAFGDRATAR